MASNARVQLRAVNSTGAQQVAVSIFVQALNRNDFLQSRARQLQRRLARSLAEASTRATQRERVMSRQTAPRSGAADRRQPNDSIGIVRAAANPNDSIAIRGPWQEWQGSRGPPRRERAGAQATLIDLGRSSRARGYPPRRHSILCLRANAQVHLRASQIEANAQHSQSLNRSSSATTVRRHG